MDIVKAYLVFQRADEIEWNSVGNIRGLPCSAGDGVIFEIPAKEVPGRKLSLDNEAGLVHVETVRILFLWIIFSLANDCNDCAAAFGSSGEFEEY